MAIATQSGTFFGLPDFGLSELLGIGAQNPDVLTSGAALYKPVVSPITQPSYTAVYGSQNLVDPYSQAAFTQMKTEKLGTTGQTGQVQGTSTYRPQAQTVGKPSGAPSWIVPGSEFSTNEGVFRMNADGSFSFLGTHTERAAAAEAARRAEQEAVNAIYSPLFASLTQQQSQLEAQLPGEEQKIEGQAKAGEEKVRTQETETQTALGEQESAVREAESNAYQQARQLYSELAQKYGALFGSRSSAGPFAMEILGRETQKQFGQTQQTAQKGVQAVATEKNRLTNWVNTQLNEWGRKKTEALTSLRNTFTNAIAQVNAQRNTLESQKAQDRYTALVDARNRQQAIEDADRSFKQQLALFQTQKEAQLTSAPEAFTYGAGGYEAAQQMAQPFSVSSLGGTTAQTGGGATAFSPSNRVGTRSGDYVFNGVTWVYSPQTA